MYQVLDQEQEQRVCLIHLLVQGGTFQGQGLLILVALGLTLLRELADMYLPTTMDRGPTQEGWLPEEVVVMCLLVEFLSYNLLYMISVTVVCSFELYLNICFISLDYM